MTQIVFSALGPKLSEQCKSRGLVATGMPLNVADLVSHGLTIAHVHGILTDTEIDRARVRLLKAVKPKPEARNV